MISTTQWRDLIQKDTRLTRTNVVFDGTDLSDYLMSYEMSDTLDQDGKASVYGMIAVKTISIVLFGQHTKYENVEISHYVEYNGSSETFVYGTFKLNEPIYDEKSDETTFTIWQDNYDETVLAPIVGATSPQDYMSKQTVIDVDTSEWTLGNTIEVVDSGTAYYETYKEMAMDMALCTSSFGIKRSDQLVYRNFTEVDYMLEYLFEVEIGETMLPVSQLMLLTDLGDNIHDGDDSGTTLQFSNLELIRNNREENIAKLFDEVEGLSYERTSIEYVGDPAIEVGDVLDYLDRDGNTRKIYVTGLEFRDNGAFNGVLHAHILTSEESHSNFVGDYTKNLKTTRIEVDKVNQTVDVILGDIDDLHEKDVQISVDLDSITTSVGEIKTEIETIELTPGPKGETGEKGADGNGITSTEIRYQKSTSGTETPTGQWLTFIPIVQGDEYLWTRITLKYKTGPDSVSYTIGGVGSQGSKGDTGADGKGISTTVVEYQKSSSGSAVPTGSWSTTLPAVLPNEYLWTRTTINYTTGSPSVAYSVGRVGKDGVKGDKGDKGDPGSRGATGAIGPRGEDGTSVTGIVEFYGLSTSDTVKPTSWTKIVSEATPLPKMTSTNKYLWNYEKINFSNGPSQDTVPVIVGVYGDKGQNGSPGVDGRSIVSIKEKYLVTSASSGVTRSTSGWVDAPTATSDTNKYLWNYEIITWNKAPITTYVDPIIIGVHGNKGDKGATGAKGPQGIQGPPGANGLPTYTWIAYATSDKGANISLSPTGKDYVGYASGQTSKTPSITMPSLYTWQLVKGATGGRGPQGVQGIQGGVGPKGDPVYTWIKYADTPTSGMTDDPTDKKYIGMAHNKPTETESTKYGDYTWSLMPQNITVGGRNYAKGTSSDFTYVRVGPYSGSLTEGGTTSQFTYTLEELGVQVGDTMTVSMYVGESEEGYGGGFRIDDQGGKTKYSTQNVAKNEYVSETFTIPEGTTEIRLYTKGRGTSGASGDFQLPVKELKLERGNVATDWTPAPEDIQAEIDDNKSKIEDVIITTTEHSSAIAQTQNSIAQEIIERTTQGEILLEQTSSLVQQTVNSFDVIFNKIEADQNLNQGEIELIQSYFRINEDGVIIGKSGSQIEFFAENDRVGFRDKQLGDIAYWEGGTMHVDKLIAVTTIMVGYHLIEKYDSPVAGNTTIVRVGD